MSNKNYQQVVEQLINERLIKIFKDLNANIETAIDKAIIENILQTNNDHATKNIKKYMRDTGIIEKGPKSGYILYCDDKRPILKEESPNLKPTEVMKELAKSWKGEKQSVRDKWNEKSGLKPSKPKKIKKTIDEVAGDKERQKIVVKKGQTKLILNKIN